MSESITDLDDAVAALGALPVPVGSTLLGEDEALLQRLGARVVELEALLAAATEFRVWEPGYGLYVRRSPGATGFAILEDNRTSRGRRAWTTSGWQYSALLVGEELFCWPDAGSAVAEARRVLPGAVVREVGALPVPAGPAVSVSVDERETVLTFTSVPDGEHYAAVHHDYRTPHDLPGSGER